LVLIGRRHVRSNNSWLHNVPALMRGRDRATLVVPPNDAAERHLVTGDPARVTTEAGSVEAVVEVSDEIRQGVVSLPHGFGHDQPGTRRSGGSTQAGHKHNRAH